jgi:hypothetical protein
MPLLLVILLLFSANAQQPDALEPEELEGGASINISHDYRMHAFVCYGGNSIHISGSGNVIVIFGACDTLIVSGSANRVRVDGPCPELILNGDRNGVDVQSADRIRANGNLNHCRWRVGFSKPEPEVDAHGQRNRVERWTRNPNAPPWGFYLAPQAPPTPAPAE